LLVEPENVEALTLALDRMFSSEELRAKFANQARGAVLDLDVANVGSRWLYLFSSLPQRR